MPDPDQMKEPTIDALRWSPLFVMNIKVDYANALSVDGSPSGRRTLFPITGGSFSGERLRGAVEPAGLDWVTLRSDGAFLIDVRMMLRTDDGARIAMTYTGLTWAEPEAMERFHRREAYAFSDIYSRTTPRFETGDSRYSWLNHTIAVANGMRTTGEGPVYHVFSID